MFLGRPGVLFIDRNSEYTAKPDFQGEDDFTLRVSGTIVRDSRSIGCQGHRFCCSQILIRNDSVYRSGRSLDWLKMKNDDAPAVKRSRRGLGQRQMALKRVRQAFCR